MDTKFPKDSQLGKLERSPKVLRQVVYDQAEEIIRLNDAIKQAKLEGIRLGLSAAKERCKKFENSLDEDNKLGDGQRDIDSWIAENCSRLVAALDPATILAASEKE